MDDENEPSFRPGQSITLLHLPFEILEQVVKYSNFSGLLSLTVTCKYMHTLFVDRLYTTIALHPGKLWNRQPPHPLEIFSTAQQLSSTLTHTRHGKIFYSLLARQQHLQGVQTLIICDMPPISVASTSRGPYIHRIMREILSGAKRVSRLSFWSRVHPPPDEILTVDVRGLQWPNNLSSLYIHRMPDNIADLRPLLARLKRLEVAFWNLTALTNLKIGLNTDLIRHLECRWWLGEDLERSHVFLLPRVEAFTIPFSNLESLTIGIAYDCWLDGGVASLCEDVLNCYVSIVRNLTRLRDLHIRGFHHNERWGLATRRKVLTELVSARPTLQSITLWECPKNYGVPPEEKSPLDGKDARTFTAPWGIV